LGGDLEELGGDLEDLDLMGAGADDPFAAIASDSGVAEDGGSSADAAPFDLMAESEEDSIVSSANAGFADDPFGTSGDHSGDNDRTSNSDDLFGEGDGGDPFGSDESASPMDLDSDFAGALGSEFGGDGEGDLGSDFESDFGGSLDEGLGGDSDDLDLGSLDLGADAGELGEEAAGGFGGFGEEALAADLAVDLGVDASPEPPAMDTPGKEDSDGSEGEIEDELGFDSSWDLEEIDGPGSMQEEGELGSDAFAHPDEVDQEFLQDVSFANNAPFGDLDDSVTLGTPVLVEVSGVIPSGSGVEGVEVENPAGGEVFEENVGGSFEGDLDGDMDLGLGSGFATETGALELGDDEGFGSLDLGEGDFEGGELGPMSENTNSESASDEAGFGSFDTGGFDLNSGEPVIAGGEGSLGIEEEMVAIAGDNTADNSANGVDGGGDAFGGGLEDNPFGGDAGGYPFGSGEFDDFPESFELGDDSGAAPAAGEPSEPSLSDGSMFGQELSEPSMSSGMPAEGSDPADDISISSFLHGGRNEK
ncbi:MAG: hypothetical protein ACFCBU_06620, partial [Cyanophyceae cyanobacterium]